MLTNSRRRLTAFSLAVIGCVAHAAVTLSLTPDQVTLQPGRATSFQSNVRGARNRAVIWNVSGGRLVPMGTRAMFVAPRTPGVYTLTATSRADRTKFDTSTITVPGAAVVAISVGQSTANLKSGASQAFTATVTGSTNTAVRWSVQEANGGTVTASGVYTAPVVQSLTTFHVVATSTADTSKTSVITVTVNPVAAVKAWTTTQIGTDAAAIGNPVIAIAADGSEMAFWQHQVQAGWNASAAYKPAGGSWQVPVVLYDWVSSPNAGSMGEIGRYGGFPGTAALVFDNAGNAYAAWEQSIYDLCGPFVFVARFDRASQTWTQKNLWRGNNQQPWYSGKPLSLTVDAQGRAVMMWEESGFPRWASFTDPSQFTDATINEYNTSTEFHLTGGAKDTIWFTSGDGPVSPNNDQSWLMRSWQNGTWTAPVVTSEIFPMISGDGAGHQLGVNVGSGTVVSSTYSSSTGWSTPISTPTLGQAEVFCPRLSMNAAGEGLLAFGFDGASNVALQAYSPTTGWKQAVSLQMPDGAPAPSFETALFSTSDALFIVLSSDDSAGSCYYTAFTPNTGWGTLTSLPGNHSITGKHAFTSSATGAALIHQDPNSGSILVSDYK